MDGIEGPGGVRGGGSGANGVVIVFDGGRADATGLVAGGEGIGVVPGRGGATAGDGDFSGDTEVLTGETTGGSGFSEGDITGGCNGGFVVVGEEGSDGVCGGVAAGEIFGAIGEDIKGGEAIVVNTLKPQNKVRWSSK